MRLLRTNIVGGELQLVSIDNPKTTKYAILSHTWIDGQEVLFHHIILKDPSVQALSGYQKVIGCCEQALRDGYEYVWIDTCCIDKSSSAELSEAINSMFLWYQEADICYAFLSDVFTSTSDPAHDSAFRGSRWFTRGWTLQELIAPSLVRFYTAYWAPLGDKKDLADIISDITGIERAVLYGASFANICVATRMLWASKRQTTRIEDRAYSLLGIFGVNMPTIYGEGTEAFARLQNEIMSRSAAHSLLAWNAYYPYDLESDTIQLLPSSPDCFELRSKNTGFHYLVDIPYRDFARIWSVQDTTAGLQKELNGLRAILPVFEVPEKQSAYKDSRIDVIVVLACKLTDRRSRQYSLGLPLRRIGSPMSNHYVKANPAQLVNIDCLIALGIPWTFKSLFLVTETLDKTSHFTPAWDLRPEQFQFQVSAENLEMLREFDDLVFVPSDEHETVHSQFDPSLEVPPSKYDRTQDGDFVFTLPNDRNGGHDLISITFAYSPKPDSSEPSHPVSLLFLSNIEPDLVSIGLVCWHAGAEFKGDNGIGAGVPYRLKKDDTVVCHKFQCECGMGVQADFVQIDSPKSGTHTFMLDIKMRSHPDPAAEVGDVSKQTVAPQVSPIAYRRLRSPRWVECAVGFAPPDAILYVSYDIGRPAYVARIARQEFTHMGEVSSPDPEIGPAKFRKNGTVVHRMSCYYQDSDKTSTTYELLAGPARSVAWVGCEDEFTLGALGGAIPVPAGSDTDEEALYFARVEMEDHSNAFLGVVKEGDLAHFEILQSEEDREWYSREEADTYEVLVYA